MYDKFYNYLNDLCDNFSKLSALLKRKMVAVEQQNIGDLDAIIGEEQVFVMITRGFDVNIKSYCTKLELKGGTLSENIEELPPEEQPRFRDMFRKLSAALEEVKALQDKCHSLIEGRLSTLDKSLKEIDKSSGTGYSKNADALKKGDHPRLFTKSV